MRMIIIPDGYPDDISASSCSGAVPAADYGKTLPPETTRRIKEHGAIRLLAHFDPEFEAMAPEALRSDAKPDLSRWSDFDRAALVSDVTRLRDAAMTFAPVLHYPVRTFENAELDQTRAWVLEGKS